MNGKHADEDPDEDAELFREAVSDVKPLAQRERAPVERRKPPARARFTAADRAMVLVESLQGFGAANADVELIFFFKEKFKFVIG